MMDLIFNMAIPMIFIVFLFWYGKWLNEHTEIKKRREIKR